MSIQTYATILLVGRILSVCFIALVIKRQLGLFKMEIDSELVNFRRVLFGLSVLIFLGNLIPITIDYLTLGADVERNAPYTIGIMYAFSNMLTALFASMAIWVLYRMAAKLANKIYS